MTEAVIALPILLFLFLACQYFHGAYRAHLRAHREAEGQAWQKALDARCKEDGEQGSVDDLAFPQSTVGSYAPGSAGVLGYGRAEAVVRRGHHVPRIMGNEEGIAKVRQRVVITCNEVENPSIKASLIEVLGTIIDTLGSSPW